MFIPYCMYFILFLVYTIWTMKRKQDEVEQSPWERAYTYKWVNLAFAIANLVFITLFGYVEFWQIIYHRLAYLKSFWNIIDLASLILNLVVVILDLVNKNTTDSNSVAAVAVLLMWVKLFYFLRIFSSTAYLIRMIIEIMIDMWYFVAVLMLAVLAFGNSFYILGWNDTNPSGPFCGDSFPLAFVLSWRMGTGDFDTSTFNTPDEILIWVLWFLNTLIINIIFFNLVIALMGDTFEWV